MAHDVRASIIGILSESIETVVDYWWLHYGTWDKTRRKLESVCGGVQYRQQYIQANRKISP